MLLGIKGRLMTYTEHNSDKLTPFIIEQIQQGLAIGLVSDAGMPLIFRPWLSFW